MILQTETADFEVGSGEKELRFIFKGKFSEEDCLKATQAWRQYCEENPHEKFVIIWDCLAMTGFEMSARREWIKHMQILSNRIASINVVCENALIRGSARIVLKLFKFNYKIVKSYDELQSMAEAH